MARIINLRKDVEHIAWSEEPGAKSYEIDFSDGGLKLMKDKLETLKGELANMAEDPDALALAIEEFVCTVAGRECYIDASAYVDTKGTGASEHTIAMMPLVSSLAEIVVERLTMTKSDAIGKYLKDQHAGADLI